MPVNLITMMQAHSQSPSPLLPYVLCPLHPRPFFHLSLQPSLYISVSLKLTQSPSASLSLSLSLSLSYLAKSSWYWGSFLMASAICFKSVVCSCTGEGGEASICILLYRYTHNMYTSIIHISCIVCECLNAGMRPCAHSSRSFHAHIQVYIAYMRTCLHFVYLCNFAERERERERERENLLARPRAHTHTQIHKQTHNSPKHTDCLFAHLMVRGVERQSEQEQPTRSRKMDPRE